MRPNLPMTIRQFTLFVIAACLLALVGVAGLNVLVDPYARYGTDLVDPIVVEPRRDKYILLRDVPQPPEVLLLGSSRAITLRPALVEDLTGRTAFNAAVTRAMPLDYVVYANYALQTYGDSLDAIVVCVDLQAMHPTVVWNKPDWLDRSPLGAYAGDYTRSAFDLDDTLTGLVSFRQAEDAATALYRNLTGQTVTVVDYTPYGETLNWDEGEVRNPASFNDMAFWESFTHIPQERFDNLDRLFALTTAHDTPLYVVFLPYLPDAVDAMQQIPGYAASDAALRAFLADRSATYGFPVLDFVPLDGWGGAPDGFVDDYYHMDQANADRVIEALFGEGGALHDAL